MKSNRIWTGLLGLVLASSLFAQAPEKFTIAGGGGAKNGSVYSDMIGTIAGVCSTDVLELAEQNTTGGPANLELLKGNKVKAALMNSDLLAAAKFNNAASVANIWTLYALHYEAAHLIARADVKKEGGFSLGAIRNLGGSEVTFNNAEDLKGRVIGAVGGSAVTANIISDQLRLGWKISTDFKDTAALLDALQAGKIDAVIVSAGLQSAAVKGIKGNFKLIPLRGNSDTANIYKAVKVEYANLNGGRSVDTLAARAVLVTRTWRSDEMLTSLGALRACISKNLGKIQDAEGSHPAWQDVDPADRGPWQWYNLPEPANTAKPAAKKKA